MFNTPLNSAGMPRIMKEQVLATRGKWVYKARIAVYHNRDRRVELIFEGDPNLNSLFDVGLTIEEVAQLHNLLVKFAQDNKEI